MKRPCLFALMAFSVFGSVAEAKCPESDAKNVPTGWIAFARSLLASDVPCQSARTVLNKLALSKPTGGRKLEEDRPLDIAQAEGNLAAALKNAEIRDKFAEADRTLTDENARLAYKAAVLDDEGFYFARDLELRTLRERLK